MKRTFRFVLLLVVIAALPACGLGTSRLPAAASLPTVRLTVVPQNPAGASGAGQVINYQFTVTNIGDAGLAGPVTVTDDKMAVVCPNVNTVGNLDRNLDPAEQVVCAGSYTLTQADVNAGSVTDIATASVAGSLSAPTTTIFKPPANKVLTLTKTANPATYSQAGQVITFTYVITNTGTAALGPAQFIVNDDHIPTPIGCGPPNTTLPLSGTITCTASYFISQADVSGASVTSSATANGAGAGTIQPASTTLTLTGGGLTPVPLPGNYVRGSTIQYKVVKGEWLIQIARCFGADPKAVSSANPQLIDPDEISPDEVLTIPNLGSNGAIYGPPCISLYTVQSGDTWSSIALKYNADVAVLQAANRSASLSSGTQLRVPLNSAGGSPSTGITPGPTACNQAQLVADLSIPDGTTLAATSTFTKTWRLKNTGTCTWTKDYVLIFDHGQQMNAPASVPVTAATIPPGSTGDISVNLTAPATPGTYQADFRLRSPDGIVFGIGSSGQATFWVKIVVLGITGGTGTPDVVSLLGKKIVGSTEVPAFQAAYTDGPCLETATGSGVLECRSKSGETPFVRLLLSNPADYANSTINDIRIFPKFTGTLPESLTWTATRAAIELRLGAPLTAPVDNGNGTIDVEYRTTNPAYRLWITFGSTDPANTALMRRIRIAVP